MKQRNEQEPKKRTATSATVRNAPRIAPSRRQRTTDSTHPASFPLIFSLALLGLVGLGFAKTFFLRPWFETYHVEGYVLWHGAAMTGWFVWLVLQTLLVAQGRGRCHRRMGWGGTVIGVVAVASGLGVNWAMLRRAEQAGRDIQGALAQWADVLWSNAAPLLVFAGLFFAAVLLRRRRDAHARLMLLGSVALIDPALARIGILPAIEWAGRTLDAWVFAWGMMVMLPLAVVGWDLRRFRFPHPATLIGVVAIWGGIPAIRWFGVHTAWGHAMVEWLV